MDNNINGEFTPEEIMEIINRFNKYLTLKGRPCQRLNRQLERVSVKELRQLALDYHINPQNRKKAELVELIADIIVDSAIIKQTLLELPRETRGFFLDVAQTNNGRYESDFESPDLFFKAVQWGLMGLYRDNHQMVFVVTKEVREALTTVMADTDFVEKLYLHETLELTLRACVNLYGIVKRQDVVDIYQRYFPDHTRQFAIGDALSHYLANREWVCVKGDFLCFPVFEDVSEAIIQENYDIAGSHGRYYPHFEDFVQFDFFEYEPDSNERTRFLELLKAVLGDEDMAEDIACAAVSVFRTGGSSDDFDDALLNDITDGLSEEEIEVISEAAKDYSDAVHSWIFCGHSFNEMCGISSKPSLSVIEGDKQSEMNRKSDSEQNDNRPSTHKPKLRLL